MEKELLKFCRKMLSKVSRSFALTIPFLNDSIYEPVMVTYLQDRLLDNFEDEVQNITLSRRKNLMDRVVNIFDPESDRSQESLEIIKDNASLLSDENLHKLTVNADKLLAAYNSLEKEIRDISFKWLQEMNNGMKKYLTKEVKTFKDLDEYCYYVAGTVGGFLTDTIIYKENIEDEKAENLKNTFKEAGLFLQKINLVRDVKNDIKEMDKSFWPVKDLDIEENRLLNEEYREHSLKALKRMIVDIKEHIPAVVKYYQNLPDTLPGYRKFYCVNKALGLATIEKMENNPDIFYGRKVKVGKLKFLRIINSPEKHFEKMTHDFV